MAIKKGDSVKQVVHPIQGVVVEKAFDDTSDTFRFLVEYEDAAGNTTQTWFDDGQLEAA